MTLIGNDGDPRCGLSEVKIPHSHLPSQKAGSVLKFFYFDYIELNT